MQHFVVIQSRKPYCIAVHNVETIIYSVLPLKSLIWTVKCAVLQNLAVVTKYILQFKRNIRIYLEAYRHFLYRSTQTEIILQTVKRAVS